MGSSTGIHELEDINFWRRLNPELCISDNPFDKSLPDFDLNQSESARCKRQVTEEGYLQTGPMLPGQLVRKLSFGIKQVFRLGVPGPFAFVYDEYWQVLNCFSKLLVPILGENYRFIPDFWAWHIVKQDSARGWSPHRDHQHGKNTLNKDGSPQLLTLWIPLTDATPLNSCMYVLPTHLDPNYPDNIDKQTVEHDQLQCVRALPAKAGSVLGWNSYVIHWGGQSSQWAEEPRISIGIYYQSKEIEPFDHLAMDFPCDVPFEFRLGIIGRSLLMYNNNKLSSNLRFSSALLGLCDKYASKLPAV